MHSRFSKFHPKKKNTTGPLRVKKKKKRPSSTGLEYLEHQFTIQPGRRVSVVALKFIRQHIYFITLRNRFEAGSCISLRI